MTDLYIANNLIIAKPLFRQHPRKLYTLTSPDGNTRNQISYMLINTTEIEDVYNIHKDTLSGADCDTDNQLIVTIVKITTEIKYKRNSTSRRIYNYYTTGV